MDVFNAAAANTLGLGGANAFLPSLAIPESNSQGYFSVWGNSFQGTTAHIAFFKNGVQYQVSSGKTFKTASIIWHGGVTGHARWQLFHSLTSWSNGASAPTGPVYQCGAVGNFFFPVVTTGVIQQLSFIYEFPALSYPGYINANPGAESVMVCLVGKEV